MLKRFKTNSAVVYYLSVFFAVFYMSSCTSPYLGRSVNVHHASVCSFVGFPTSCHYNSEHFVIDYILIKTEKPNEYKIQGTADSIQGTSGTWTDFSEATFTLLLVENGIVVDSITIGGGQGSLDQSISFSRYFETEYDFKATLINYQMNVRG